MSNSTNKLFAKLGHGFADDPKIIGLSDKAFRVYVESLLYACSNMTDGFLDERVLRRYGWLDAAEELTTNDDVPSWVKADGGYQIHAFCDWQMTSDKHAKQVINGRAGGLAKARNRQQASEVVAGASKVLEQTASENLPDKDIDKDKDKELKPLAITSPEFETWWTEYPKKVAKPAAIKAWKGAISKTAIDVLLDSVKAYAVKNANTEQTYIANPATWLNQERWNDEPEVPKMSESEWHEHLWRTPQPKFGEARYENVETGDDR